MISVRFDVYTDSVSWSELRRTRPAETICFPIATHSYRFEFLQGSETRLRAGNRVVVLNVCYLRFHRILGKQIADRLVVDLQNAHAHVEKAVCHLEVNRNRHTHLRHRRQNVPGDQRQKASG